LELTLRVEHHWLKTESQVDFLRLVWADLRDELRIHQNNILQVLYFKINEATVLLDQSIGEESDDICMKGVTSKKGCLKKGKFALKFKTCLEKCLNDLITWQGMLDPSWYLMTLLSSVSIDRHLTAPYSTSLGSKAIMKGMREELRTESTSTTKSIFFSAAILSPQRRSIPFSPSQLSFDERTSERVIVDTYICPHNADLDTTTKDIRDLARVLSKIDPVVFGLLSCRGVIKDDIVGDEVGKFEFVLSLPPKRGHPTSLRDLLIAGSSRHALNDRLDIAKQLASSVLFIHTSHFVHKNIRPEAVLVFPSDTSALGSSYLVGFEKFRPQARQTYKMGDFKWERNLYRHARRQGVNPEEDFKMQHDIYSLGVCLLEIGIWTSFVLYEEGVDEPIPSPGLKIAEFLKLKDQRKKAAEIKKVLVQLADEHLPSHMGRKYTEIVLACLTCLDNGATGFGEEDDILDEDGIVVGVRYIEKVLCHLLPMSLMEN
jgi:hypothetical protein